MHFSQILFFVFFNKHVLSRNASIDREVQVDTSTAIEGALQELRIAMHLQILILDTYSNNLTQMVNNFNNFQLEFPLRK